MTVKMACAALMAAALSATVGAQAKKINEPQHHMDGMDSKKQAYVGCVAAGESANVFVLKAAAADTMMHGQPDAMQKPMAKAMDKPMDKAMDKPMDKAMDKPMMSNDSFRLNGSHLKNYVGRTVSVQGSLTNGGGQMSQAMPTLTVKSIKVLSGTCSQAD